MKKVILLYLFLSFIYPSYGQELIKGCVITIENGKAYLDVTSPKVKLGDVLSLHEESGYMIHPVTKKKIKKEGGILADLEIVELAEEYSVATIYPESAIPKIKIGTYAVMYSTEAGLKSELEETVTEDSGKNYVYETLIQPEISSFSTAEDVIKWHYECTGFKKFRSDNIHGQLVEREIIRKNKKGKEKSTYRIITITHIPTERLYKKGELFMRFGSRNDLLSSATIVINGNNGWLKVGKKTKPITSDKYRQSFWESLKSEVDSYLNGNYYNQLIGYQYVDGKKCIGIRIEDRKKGDNFRNYYDVSNGWLVASYVTLKGKNEELVKVKEYKNFGGIMMPSIVETIDEKGRVTTVRTIRYDLNYSLDNILFTADDTDKTF